jgi:hypothetical protein
LLRYDIIFTNLSAVPNGLASRQTKTHYKPVLV